jgi:hypothetical protein
MVNSLLWNLKRASRTAGGLCICLGLLSGCSRDEITVYRVAKEQKNPAAPNALPPGHPDTTSAGAGAPAGPRLKASVPPGWQESPAGEMRVASYRVQEEGKQAEVGVVPLPGLMGRDLESVNRWRATVGQPAVKEEDLSHLAQPVEVGGHAAQLFEQAGENPGSGEKTRILAAILRHEGVAWFFKMTGDDALVEKQKPAFLGFLNSVSFDSVPEAVAAGGGMENQALPPTHPPLGESALAAPANVSSERPTWQIPAAWREVDAGQFLMAKFMVSGSDNTQAAVNVSMSAGAGGGLASNVNRWRGQLGLPELSEAEVTKLLTPLEALGDKAWMVDLSGTDSRSGQKARLVAAIVTQPGQTWFYKLMGNEQVVERERSAFSKFVQSAKYH